MTPEQKAFIISALDRLDDEDNMNRYKLAIKKGTAAYPASVIEDFKVSVEHLKNRIAMANQIKEELKK